MKLVDKIVSERVLLVQVLRDFYGLGYARSSAICIKFGLPVRIKMGQISLEQLSSLEVYLREYEYFAKDLALAYRKSLIFHKKRGNFRGVRLWMGLPVRGQRSHTNASTVSKLFKGMKSI